MTSEKQDPVLYQNIVIMRHGERLDNFDPLWASTAARPWDPPLAQPGKVRTFQMAQEIQQSLNFPIHRIFVSPFLRCVQTVAQLFLALSSIHDALKKCSSIDPSKVKVSIEYGLCEMINNIAIRPNVAPKDGNVSFNISESAAMLPAGIEDNNVEKVYNEVPQWGETVLQARERYLHTIKDLADKYPNENLLFFTHGEAIKTALISFRKDIAAEPAVKIEYCGYIELRRPIFETNNLFTFGNFDVVTDSGQTGVSYISKQD